MKTEIVELLKPFCNNLNNPAGKLLYNAVLSYMALNIIMEDDDTSDSSPEDGYNVGAYQELKSLLKTTLGVKFLTALENTSVYTDLLLEHEENKY